MKKFIGALLALVLLAPMQSALAVPDPINCTGYPEARYPIEAQVWWDATGLNPPTKVGEHIHATVCWPTYGTIVTGTLHIDLRILVHEGDENTHHFLERMRVNWRPYNSESGGGLLLDNTGDWDIPLDANGSGSRIFPIDLNLSSLGTATRRIRINPMAGEDPDKMFPGWEGWLCVRACNTSTIKTTGKGWYSDHGYQNASFNSLIPTSPKSGNWTFNVNMNPGGDGRATVQHGIFIDPDAHNGSLGRIVRLANGTFSGNVTIDTRTLSNGPHKLVLMARDANLAGLQVIPFVVSN